MKNFCKWLGVSDKIARLIVWLFIGMAFLIVTNIMLESIGLPYYKITVDNLSKINTNVVFDYLFNWTLILLNFYSMVFLIFRINKFRKIFPYSILYLILNILMKNMFGSIGTQTFIILFTVLFCYFYSKKNVKYILYGIFSVAFNMFVQFICYQYKLRFIDYSELNILNKFLTSIDYFIIILVIILIKEIVVKKKKGE